MWVKFSVTLKTVSKSHLYSLWSEVTIDSSEDVIMIDNHTTGITEDQDGTGHDSNFNVSNFDIDQNDNLYFQNR